MKITDFKRTGFYYALSMTLVLLLTGCQQQTETNESQSEDSEMEETTQEDMGKQPWVLDIEKATVNNNFYREARWTGDYMQMTLMSLKPGEIINLELHENIDQFIRIEQGEARVKMGEIEEDLSFDETISDDWAIFIPAGYWHELHNTGDTDLKLYSIYTPAEHPSGTIHETYDEAKEHEHDHDHDH